MKISLIALITTFAAPIWAHSGFVAPYVSRSASSSICMDKFNVSYALKFGSWALESLNRTTPDDMHKLGCVTKCTLTDVGKLGENETLKEAYEKVVTGIFEQQIAFMRNNLDNQLKGIKKCDRELKGNLEVDECIYAYKMENCVRQHGVYLGF